MINYVAIGRRVKKYRTKAHITQAQLAELLNVSVSYVSQIECGITEVSLKRLEEIANIINTKLEHLVAEPIENTDISRLEIEEIMRHWSTEQIITLIKIIRDLDQYFNPSLYPKMILLNNKLPTRALIYHSLTPFLYKIINILIKKGTLGVNRAYTEVNRRRTDVYVNRNL